MEVLNDLITLMLVAVGQKTFTVSGIFLDHWQHQLIVAAHELVGRGQVAHCDADVALRGLNTRLHRADYQLIRNIRKQAPLRLPSWPLVTIVGDFNDPAAAEIAAAQAGVFSEVAPCADGRQRDFYQGMVSSGSLPHS